MEITEAESYLFGEIPRRLRRPVYGNRVGLV